MLGAQGTVEGYEDKYVYGRRANGFYISRFANLYGDKRDFLRGYGYQGSASRQGWSREIAELNIGADFKEALTEPGSWAIGATGFGEILPYHENKISLSKTVKVPLTVDVLEIFVVEILDKINGLTGAFHFRPELLLDLRKFLIAEYGDLNGVSFATRLKFKVLDFLFSEHHLSSIIDIRLVVCFCNKRNGA